MSMRYPAGFISAFYNPLQNPNAPTIGTATASSTTSLSITFTTPTNVGGGPITGFVATAKRTSDGVSFSGSGASSPITVSGLTAVPFTVTVAAVNTYGPSASSAASNSVTPAMQPGDVFGGGFFAGQISTAGNSIADYNLVVGPRSSADNPSPNSFNTSSPSSDPTSVIDGPANSSTMNNASHPAAQFCEGLTIGGFSDWYLPAKNELEVCYFNLKPSAQANDTSSGINPNAVPARASNYTSGNPAQTSATDFKDTTNLDYFSSSRYWTSTQASATEGFAQSFGFGRQYNYIPKTNYSNRVRAIRRVAV